MNVLAQIAAHQQSLSVAQAELELLPGEYDAQEIRHYSTLWSYPNSRALRRRLSVLSRIADLEVTIDHLERKRRLASRPPIFTQASVVTAQESGPVSGGAITTSENFTDMGGNEIDYKDGGQSDFFAQGQAPTVEMSEFFERPIEIASFNIPLGGSLNAVYPIWDLYTINPTVRAKLRNYAYFNADIHVRISVSGSPFHYGRLLASYQPYPLRNQCLDSLDTLITAFPTARNLLLNYLSQATGAVTIDVKENQPTEIHCPFISPKPMFRLFNDTSTVISAVTSYSDLANAGSLYLYTINDVGAVNALASPVSVQIYAYATNVQLGCPTGTQITITTEADEREIGPVEAMSSSMASVLGAMDSIPYIGDLAFASSIALTGVSKFAAWFGWSKPVMISEPNLVKNEPYANGTQTIGYSTAKRVTLDPKQELTLGSRMCGSSDDDMVIANIASRETYLETFSWAPSDDLLASPIYLCRVHPGLCSIYEDIANRYYQPSAMAFAVAPFAYWRADIVFRFEIVCSAYHRGKIAIFYEPNISQHLLINSDLSLNKNFMKIIDIQETQSVEFCVSWASPRAWNKNIPPTELRRNTEGFSGTSYADGYVNGYIGVVPFTDVQSPDDSSVEVNVYVSAIDFHVNRLTDLYTPKDRVINTESGVLGSQDSTCMELNPTTATTSNISTFHFGEQPVSFRALLKRYATTRIFGTGVGSVANPVLNMTTTIVPLPTPQFGTSTTQTVSLFGYLRYAYLGLKGSVRKRLIVSTSNPLGVGSHTNVSLEEPSTSNGSSIGWTGSWNPSSIDGNVLFVPHTNAGVEVELPFYTNNLFVFSFADDSIGTNALDEMETSWTKLYTVSTRYSDSTQDSATFYEESASGEDFTLMRYTGAPFYHEDV